MSREISAKAALLVVAALWLSAVSADREGRGESTVVGGNLVSARARALELARRDCVWAAIAAELGAERAAGQRPRLSAVVARFERYLRSYRVLEEGQQGPRFVMRLACRLDEATLRRSVEQALGGALAAAPAGPVELRVRLLPGARPLLAERLLQHARATLERAGVKLASTTASAGFAPGAAAVDLEVRTTAELPIRGLSWPAWRATAQASIAGSALGPSREAYGMATTDKRAQRLACERAIDHVLAGAVPLLRASQPGTMLGLKVRGLRTAAAVQELRRVLEETGNRPRLTSVTAGEVAFDVEATGGALALASSLRARSPAGLVLSRQQITGDTLWLTFTPAP